MRRVLSGLFLAGVMGALLWGTWDWWYYHDRQPVVSPLPQELGLKIRDDWRGDGYFLAKRKGGRRHFGVDLVAPVGTPVFAAKGGRVEVSRHKGYGRFIRLHHARGLTTLYAHLSRIVVISKQRVRQGELIGYTGKTGNARYRGITPHLHFEVRRAGRPIDPAALGPALAHVSVTQERAERVDDGRID